MAAIDGKVEFLEYKFHPCIYPHRDAHKSAFNMKGLSEVLNNAYPR